MTLYDNPNREAVGLEPIWVGAGAELQPVDEGEQQPAGYDPGEHTVDEVRSYVAANPDQAQVVLAAEVDGKNRSTLVDWLQGE